MAGESPFSQTSCSAVGTVKHGNVGARKRNRGRVKAEAAERESERKRLGRPSRALDAATVPRLRGQVPSWRAISTQLGVGLGPLYRAVPVRSKNQEEFFGNRALTVRHGQES
jgi:hypothetical protein